MIPKNLQGVLWSVGIDKLDLQKDKAYIINQVLAYGTWGQLKWLFRVYSKKEIKKIFVEKPQKDYVFPSFNFVKNFLLDLNHTSLNPAKYVKTFPRNLG
ncbi:hypothetical protein A3D00_04600 [Candidatus Woesebacteria bacterium RIFCSPHIGHO2_02_FULL_38_9]|uniref:DUF6922 domain-containing protein n=1 Tax=Candidatus Woesebacteria bacterium RIFCSPHIGHO2_01_FULL_39_28 TaxID=1802496 RepID=A0A1F7YKW3_9BACT|nr:MAG: hypothetical protein A2627_00420 [Candidatus Woesebacteria bacterium RIFCSPHIGHO2_01_FULL_39_28]OGM31907.1 MAG: hypothetical protein A3D00_04600 [Candidatus Woesebacteria bacterium RIFCSPHIGHO2_02_FULL_38_9]OGM56723.1 MAG: hypothetical protein A3A50_05200 [Candidatus Woesebacteria bacterium RIFCSPLOWO2_01_FULL_38_20]